MRVNRGDVECRSAVGERHDGIPVATVNGFLDALEQQRVGAPVSVTLLRGDERVTIEVRLDYGG